MSYEKSCLVGGVHGALCRQNLGILSRKSNHNRSGSWGFFIYGGEFYEMIIEEYGNLQTPSLRCASFFERFILIVLDHFRNAESTP